MNMPSAQLERFEALESANLMRFRPILLPQPPIVKGDNNHIAWPIATLATGCCWPYTPGDSAITSLLDGTNTATP